MSDDDGLEPLPPSLRRTWGDTTTMVDRLVDRLKRGGGGVVGLDYVIWVNADRTVMVTRWDSGEMEVALRGDRGETWGPPIRVVPEAEADRTDA